MITPISPLDNRSLRLRQAKAWCGKRCVRSTSWGVRKIWRMWNRWRVPRTAHRLKSVSKLNPRLERFATDRLRENASGECFLKMTPENEGSIAASRNTRSLIRHHLYVMTAWPSSILMSPTSGGSRSFSRFSGDAIIFSTAEFSTDCGRGIEPSIPLMGSNFM